VRVVDAVAEAATVLAAAHVGSPRVDAELLAAFVLAVPRASLTRAQLTSDPRFTDEQLERFRGLVRDRANTRVPLQYLTGSAPFRRLELAVGPGVFVPRPETEVLVEWGLQWLKDRPGSVVADVCAGSGAIAASVRTEAPGTTVLAVERDPAALEWLRRNVLRYGVTVVAGDATDPAVLADQDGAVDLVLCNPPYVPEIGAAGLPVEVTRHDPHAAVFGGTDGLDVIRPLIHRFATLLRAGGAMAIEHDDTHAYVVPTLIHTDGRFTDIALHHDLAGRPRFTTATRGSSGPGVADLRP
jgi:release factor glutamine methyltransferase